MVLLDYRYIRNAFAEGMGVDIDRYTRLFLPENAMCITGSGVTDSAVRNIYTHHISPYHTTYYNIVRGNVQQHRVCML